MCVWRTKLLTTHNGHGQSGWPPISCEGLDFHAEYRQVGGPLSVVNVFAQI